MRCSNTNWPKSPSKCPDCEVKSLILHVVAPQGFEPRYAAPEAAVLPLNEGAMRMPADVNGFSIVEAGRISVNSSPGCPCLDRASALHHRPVLRQADRPQ